MIRLILPLALLLATVAPIRADVPTLDLPRLSWPAGTATGGQTAPAAPLGQP